MLNNYEVLIGGALDHGGNPISGHGGEVKQRRKKGAGLEVALSSPCYVSPEIVEFDEGNVTTKMEPS